MKHTLEDKTPKNLNSQVITVDATESILSVGFIMKKVWIQLWFFTCGNYFARSVQDPSTPGMQKCILGIFTTKQRGKNTYMGVIVLNELYFKSHFILNGIKFIFLFPPSLYQSCPLVVMMVVAGLQTQHLIKRQSMAYAFPQHHKHTITTESEEDDLQRNMQRGLKHLLKP